MTDKQTEAFMALLVSIEQSLREMAASHREVAEIVRKAAENNNGGV